MLKNNEDTSVTLAPAGEQVGKAVTKIDAVLGIVAFIIAPKSKF